MIRGSSVTRLKEMTKMTEVGSAFGSWDDGDGKGFMVRV